MGKITQLLLLCSVVAIAACAGVQPQAPVKPKTTSDIEPLLTNVGSLTNTQTLSTFDAESEPLYRLLVAEFAGQRGRLDLAVENYLSAAEELRSVDVAQRAARIAVFARNTTAAIAATTLWVELEPENSEARQILAAMHIREGNAVLAGEHLEAVLNADPSAEERQLKMIVNLLGREQDKQTAFAVMEKLLEQRQGDADALVAYALLAIRAERLDKAAEAVGEVVENDMVDVNLAMAYTAILQKNDKTRDALAWLQKTVNRFPDKDGIRMIYARLLADANRYEEARDQFLNLAERSPDNSDVIYALGLLNLQSDRVDEAESMFNRLLELDVRADEAMFYLGQIAESRENVELAMERYRSVSGGLNYFQSQVRVALLLANVADIEGARAQLKSIQTHSDEEKRELIRAEAEMLVQVERYEDAMALYDTALENTYDMEMLYTRAMLAEQMGRIDILERDLRVIIEKEPKNSQALNALGYTLADRTERYEEAYGLIERALEISPNDFYILDSMGWVLYRLGRFTESIEFLEKARALKDDPEVAAHLGEVLWVMGNHDEARELINSAIKDTPDDERLLNVLEKLQTN